MAKRNVSCSIVRFIDRLCLCSAFFTARIIWIFVYVSDENRFCAPNNSDLHSWISHFCKRCTFVTMRHWSSTLHRRVDESCPIYFLLCRLSRVHLTLAPISYFVRFTRSPVFDFVACIWNSILVVGKDEVKHEKRVIWYFFFTFLDVVPSITNEKICKKIS